MNVLATSTGALHCQRSHMRSFAKYIQLAWSKLSWKRIYFHQDEGLAPEPLPQRLCKVTQTQFPLSFLKASLFPGLFDANQIP